MRLASTPRQRAWLMVFYGLFLLASGLYGYKITSTHSTSALFNGGVFGALFIVLGILHAYGRAWTHVAALSASVIFCLTFLWRASLQWGMADFFGPTYDFQLEVAVLLSVMAAVSALIAAVLLKSLRR
ncbi:MAG: TMEM14 family protein [Ignavibacteria bacterium]